MTGGKRVGEMKYQLEFGNLHIFTVLTIKLCHDFRPHASGLAAEHTAFNLQQNTRHSTNERVNI